MEQEDMKRMQEEGELYERLKINKLKETIEAESDRERNRIRLVLPERPNGLSLNDLLAETEKGTELGKRVLELHEQLRYEKARRGYE